MHESLLSPTLAPVTLAFFLVLSGMLAIASNTALGQDLSAKSIVELTTASGRTFRGTISPKSNFDTVRITSSRGSIELTRPIAWKAIRGLTINEQPANFEQLTTLIRRIHDAEAESGVPPKILSLGPSTMASHEHEVSIEQKEAGRHSAPVAYLSAWATCKSWNRDPAVDGLEVTFTAEDSQGLPTAVKGHLEAELYAFQGASYSEVPHGEGSRFQRIGSWRIPLDETTARYDSRVARLRYQGTSPSTDGDISPLGILVLTLVVPGQGTFSTTLEDVRLRPYSVVRDTNQLRGAPRYTRGENPRFLP